MSKTPDRLNPFTDPLYEQTLAAIEADPEAVIRERRMDQISALKLAIPGIIKARRTLRRKAEETYKAALKEKEQREVEVRLAVKTERDANNKLQFPNKESREAEVEERLRNDANWLAWDRQFRSAYAEYKGFDDETDYYERLDQSLIEIMAMFTALIEFETRYNRTYTDASTKNRSGLRAKRRADLASRPSEESASAT